MVYIEVLLLDVYYMMQLKDEKFKLKSIYKNNYKINTARIKNKYLIIKAEKRHFLKIGKLAEFLTVLSNSLKSLKQWYRKRCFPQLYLGSLIVSLLRVL